MRLIDPNIITMSGDVSDTDLKARLVREALEQADWLDAAGNPLKGVTTSITRSGGQSGKGKWCISVTRDLRMSNQARLAGPEKADG